MSLKEDVVVEDVFSGVPGRADRRWPIKRFGRLAADFGGRIVYQWFEQAIILILTMLIIAIVAVATWHLAEVVGLLILSDQVQPANQVVFQTLFGMIFTVIIALEFKHSLLIVLARQESVVRVRSIILIAMLAMVRKFIILDLGEGASVELFALSAAILALGIVYWLVREQDRRQAHERDGGSM
jgi:uncharacterized membrane protein (DUF373 family)